MSENEQNRPEYIVFWEGNFPKKQKYFKGETILQTARRAGLDLMSNCEKGNCGTCLMRLKNGEVQMLNNEVLSDTEIGQGYRLGCQAVPVSGECEVEIF